jgi:hypothetical protein
LPPLHPYGRDNAKPDKQQEEEDLSYASDRYDTHGSISKRVEIVEAIKHFAIPNLTSVAK